MKLKVLSVAQVNNYIKRIIQSDPILSNISVGGELSNIKYHGTGNVFLTLKDENSKINCFIGSQNVAQLKHILEDGMKVVVHGYIFLYDRNGTYSLNIKNIEVQGAGDLHLAFERLKAKLKEEGLFEESHKVEIPFFPKKVGIITSETGAAIQDMIRTITNKNNYTDILVFPSLVQGAYAAADIAKKIDLVNERYSDVDTLIIGRGGGSLEELWAFNEEIVARSIFNSKIPVISAVGHETDFSISDFVADYRAATPTAAAEKAVFDTVELDRYIEELNKLNKINIDKMLINKYNELKQYDFKVLFKMLENNITVKEYALDSMLNDIITKKNEKLTQLEHKMDNSYQAIENLNPKRIMDSGYTIIQGKQGRIVNKLQDITEGDIIKIMLTDGDADAEILEKNTKKEVNDMGDELKNQSFEQSLDKLEAVTENLKEGNVSLQDMLELYEEGIIYYKKCRKLLDGAKQQIQTYNQELDTMRKDS